MLNNKNCKGIQYSMTALALFTSATTIASADEISSSELFQQCLSELVVTADPNTTVKELHATCNTQLEPVADSIDTATEKRQLGQQVVAHNQFTLLQHRSNYLLPLAYNFKAADSEPIGPNGELRNLDPTEFKFQISFKSLLWDNIMGSDTNLYAAYTNTSWWQAYNKDNSSPFRETNHQPELFIDIPNDISIGDWELANIRLGISHQSNGRAGDFSRTWNRAFAEFAISDEFNEIRLRPWTSLSDIEDNPDIEEYRGRFELGGTHLVGDHTFTWAARHTLDRNSRGSFKLDWSFPIAERDDLQFFVQYFDGYGESLIDYDVKSRRLGLGFKLGN